MLSLLRARVQSMVRELRSHKPHGAAKNESEWGLPLHVASYPNYFHSEILKSQSSISTLQGILLYEFPSFTQPIFDYINHFCL